MLLINDIKWKLKNFITQNEFLFKAMKLAFFKGAVHVKENHHLTLEGFPRSGNTFCIAAILTMASNEVYISRHRHEIGQVVRSLKYNVPVNIIIRDPANSITSFVIRERVSLKFALSYYHQYHSYILRKSYQISVFDFDEFVQFPEKYSLYILEHSKYTGGFNSSHNIKHDIKEMIIQMELKDSGLSDIRSSHISLPSQSKENAKDKLKAEIYDKYEKQLEQCVIIYSELQKQAIKL